jgi:hypothetical protein
MIKISNGAREQTNSQLNTARALVMRKIYLLARLYWRLMRPLTLGVRAIVTNESGEVLLLRHTYKNGLCLRGESEARGIIDTGSFARVA